MPTTQDILQFHFLPATFHQSAQKIIPIILTSLNEHRIDKLQKITDEVGASSFTFSGNNLIPQVFIKFKGAINNNLNIVFERRELRTLTYSLNHSEQNLKFIFGNEIELNYALKLLESNWRDSFLVGLIDCFLKNWETKHQNSLEQLEQFITKKLDNYRGNRSTLISFKNKKRYFSTKNGDLILGDTIAKLNKPIQEATKILGVPYTWFNYPYFSKVILTYYERNKNDIFRIIDSLDEVLSIHSYVITKKRLIPRIVFQATELNFLTIKDRTKKIALAHLKDPQNKGESLWGSFAGDISDSDINNLRKAKEIVLQWMAEEFIDFFFKECINDSRRRRFWVKYSKHISLFKIVGSTYIKQMLLINQTINKLVEPRFASTNSYSDRNSALMFVIKDYLFVEFSDEGAFYAYKLTNPSAPSIESKFFFQTSDLKTPSMSRLAYRSGYYIKQTNIEGKLGHNDGDLPWEEVARYWLQNIAGINV